jgi:hypothetical protein
MDILNSEWFLSMVKKSGNTPQQRLLGMFDVLADWLAAPLIREQLAVQGSGYPTPTEGLLRYLTMEARTCGFDAPEALTQQLYFIAIAALNEGCTTNNRTSLVHAKVAAGALLRAQKQATKRLPRPFSYGIAASLFGLIAIGGMLTYKSVPPETSFVTAAKPITPVAPASAMASPAQTAQLLASMELMRKGTCHFPEALQLPDSEKAVYLENVVGGQITVNAREQKLVKKLMEKVRCNYTPMLMANSVG